LRGVSRSWASTGRQNKIKNRIKIGLNCFIDNISNMFDAANLIIIFKQFVFSGLNLFLRCRRKLLISPKKKDLAAIPGEKRLKNKYLKINQL
jgi:hypothetical protein